MKILILANNDVGLYRFRKELILELIKNHEVYIALPYGELVEPLKDAGCIFIDTPIDRRGINPFKDVKIIKKYNDVISEISPDLVVTYTIKPNIYGGFVCRLKKVKYACNITGLGTVFEKGGLLCAFVKQLYRVALKKARVVFFENSYNMDVFISQSIIGSDKAFLLSGAGVNLQEFTYQDYPDNDVFQFLFIGRIMKEKGIDELFASVQQLRARNYNCCLNVVGAFEDDYKSIIDNYINEGWLNYYGYQSDVRPFLKACDCFVLPSYHEGMANTNLEAAASGRPIITSNIPGCKEAVIDGKSGFLCEPKNITSLYDRMEKMILTDNRKDMGIVGRKHMESVFDKRVVVAKTISQLSL